MRLKVGIIGSRGIPNRYGGFEQLAEHLSVGLVNRGCEVTVYNSHRHPAKLKQWNGVSIIRCFDPEYLIGSFGQFVYDLLCILDSYKRGFDIILVLGYTSSSIWKLLFPRGPVIITNMDGLEWSRSKYSPLTKKFLKYAEKLAVLGSHYCIADSVVIKSYLDKKYGIDARYIAYGARIPGEVQPQITGEYGINAKRYFMLMARMESENSIEVILDGFQQSGSTNKFLVIGNANNRYGRLLQKKYKADSNIIFAGAIYDHEKVSTLINGSLAYFHGHSVGGTNPSLLEAMASKGFIIAHSNDFNKSVLGENACFFQNSVEVSRIISNLHLFPAEKFIENNFETVQNKFNWERIIDEYHAFLEECYLDSRDKKLVPLSPFIEK